MKKTQKIVAVVTILAGAVFLFIGGTDIQLGFGLVLVFQGILGYPTK